MIFPVWQTLGQSSHRLAAACGQALAADATHTGTLDPMAEGVLVVLTDDDRFAKGHLDDWQKTYQFSILWGVETDSGDQLGLVQCMDRSQVLRERIVEALAEFPHTYNQTTPAFSALRVDGMSGFERAKAGLPVPIKKRTVVLEELKLIAAHLYSAQDVLSQHQQNVSRVLGQFRQESVLASWKEHVGNFAPTTELLVTSHQVTTSPGTYIRQLVTDIAARVGIPASTWTITRTQNGPYQAQDCVKVDELTEILTPQSQVQDSSNLG